MYVKPDTRQHLSSGTYFMASTVTFSFIHSALRNGMEDVLLPAQTSHATLHGLFCDLTGVDVVSSELTLTLVATSTGKVAQKTSVLGLLRAAQPRILVSLESITIPQGVPASFPVPKVASPTAEASDSAEPISGRKRTRASLRNAARTPAAAKAATIPTAIATTRTPDSNTSTQAQSESDDEVSSQGDKPPLEAPPYPNLGHVNVKGNGAVTLRVAYNGQMYAFRLNNGVPIGKLALALAPKIGEERLDLYQFYCDGERACHALVEDGDVWDLLMAQVGD
jgi:hypothetical protein